MPIIRIVVNDPCGITLVEGTDSRKVEEIKNAQMKENPRDAECVIMTQRVLGSTWTCFEGRGNGDNDEYIFVTD
jgi:hypothetical protein